MGATAGSRESAPALGAEATQNGPDAIVLGLNVTGLAVVRALAANGINVHAASFSSQEPGRASRRCAVIDLKHLNQRPEDIIEWLDGVSREKGGRPVVFPVSDDMALMLAKHRVRLEPVIRMWKNSEEQLQTIVEKNKLYDVASHSGIAVPPGVISPGKDELSRWCDANDGPYLVKPYYVGTAGAVDFKNRTFAARDELIAFLGERDFDTSGLIIQRILSGGDGRIFDCYGLCDADGKIKVLASHRRIRQYPPDFGITCLGEIPVTLKSREDELFELTRTLLARVRYHGIFGIEWLLEEATNKFYLLDFNARPFYTIGHLCDCGINLPLLAYRELRGERLVDQPETPKLKHLYWLDFWALASTYSRLRGTGRMGWKDWSSALIRSRSHALWDVSDPGPAWRRTVQGVSMLGGKLKKGGQQ